MMILKLVECTDYREDYGVIVIKNDKITKEQVQDKIQDFKCSYKAYGYSTLKEMREDGYRTVEELMDSESPCWDVDQLVASFPKSWKASRYDFDGIVEC